jgi:copper chaperone
METTTLKIGGMTCGGCVASVERVLRGLDGVGRAEVSLANNEAKIEFEPDRVKLAELESAIEDAGYEVVR